jgi:thiamine pyrophosphate-dependent acetolactate synthase large subunit-like protein
MGTMEAHSDWYNRTTKEIGSRKDMLSPKDAKKYKLDLLLRIVGRVEEFTSMCGECQLSQQEITTLSQDLGYLLQMPKPNKEARKRYFKAIDNIVKHLQKEHKLVTEGQNKGKWILAGMAISAAIGAVLDQPGIGTVIGFAIGIAIGSYMDKKAKEEGRVI